MNEQHIIILSGPSGVGKDTIIDLWKNVNSSIYKVVTYTTRSIREGEQDKIDYIFMCSDEFEKKIKEDYFIEHTKIYDYYYGTSKESILNALEKDKWVVLKIDVLGALNLMKVFPNAITLFLMPPTLQELEKRIFKRDKDTFSDIQKRLLKAQEEIEQSIHYQHIVINQEINDTVIKLENILRKV